MLTYPQEASGSGRIDVNGETSPVSYNLFLDKSGSGYYHVRTRLSVPRDWLLERGFSGEAVLVRGNGQQIRLHRDGALDVGDAISVELEESDSSCATEREVRDKYPELA